MNGVTQPGKRGFYQDRRLSSFLSDRRFVAMLLLGIASGLPYAVITGTLSAWLTSEQVSVATIGVLSWSGLAYSFKFLWAPALHRAAFPMLRRLGLRRSVFVPLQLLIALCLAGFSLLDPGTGLSLIAALAVTGAALSATFDIVVDTWRIETAREQNELDSLTACYQFGYRAAAFIGGAGALILSDVLGGWSLTLGILGLVMVCTIAGALVAPEPVRAETSEEARAKDASETDVYPIVARNAVVALVLLGWGWSFWTLGAFMIQALGSPETAKPGPFTLTMGPLIVAATVLTPALGGLWLVHLGRGAGAAPGPKLPKRLQRMSDSVFGAVVLPMIELVGRMGWAAISALLLILTYRFTDSIWGSFAYPFYMGDKGGALGHTATEVALASKMIGVLAVILGIVLGGMLVRLMGRMPALVLAAVLAAATNLLFADLAEGAPAMDAFLRLTHLDNAYLFVGLDIRMARLTTAIMGENLAVGFASVVYVAYLSSIVNPRFAAVQYALLGSLTMLIGQLGRPAIGAMIETDGFAPVFVLTALLGLIPVALSVFEWMREQRRAHASPENTSSP